MCHREATPPQSQTPLTTVDTANFMRCTPVFTARYGLYPENASLARSSALPLYFRGTCSKWYFEKQLNRATASA